MKVGTRVKICTPVMPRYDGRTGVVDDTYERLGVGTGLSVRVDDDGGFCAGKTVAFFTNELEVIP